MENIDDRCDNLLISLRKIIRAVDLYSKQLEQKYGLTGPQLLILKTIFQSGGDAANTTNIANQTSLSLATVTSIIDRLVDKGYVVREKSTADKRKTMLHITESAKVLIAKNPKVLQEDFIDQFKQLKNWEQSQMIATLERVAEMMHAKSIDAAPVLTNSDIDKE